MVVVRSKHLCKGCGGIIEAGELCVQSQKDFSLFWHAECKNTPKRRMSKTVRNEKQIIKTEEKLKIKSLVRWL